MTNTRTEHAGEPAALEYRAKGRTDGRFPFTVIALFVLMALSCAKQGYPPGGPEDKVLPKLVRSNPDFQATNVSRTDPIMFEFSETMDVTSIENNVFIVPIPAMWPEFRWKSRDRILEIQFAEPLLENTTYVISLGSKARDLRRNELEESIMLSFSTGSRIENRKIRGTVVPFTFYGGESEQVSGIDVAGFKLGGGTSPDPRFDVPDYVTQSGADGSYEMIGLSGGTYRLFAIGDADKNGFYSEGYDRIGVAPIDVVLAEEDTVATAPDIAISSRDTSAVQLLSIGVPDSRRVELFFSRRIEPDSLSCAFDGLGIEDIFVSPENQVVMSVATAPQTAGKRYTLKSLNVADADGNRQAALEEAPYFIGKDNPDTTSLAVVKMTPSILSPDKETVSLVFNRALDDAVDGGSALAPESTGNLDIRRTGPNSLEILPADTWKENMRAVFVFNQDIVKGRAGNRLKDEDARIELRVVQADTLGFIEGTIGKPSEGDGKTVYVELKNIDFDNYRKITAKDDATWATGAVLPGRYLCRAFRDDDGDGSFSRGSVKPYRPAEPVASIADTIVVVSRWTNSDNTFLFRGFGKKSE